MTKLSDFTDDMCCYTCRGDVSPSDVEMWNGEGEGPMCSRCIDINREMAERFYQEERDREWDRREASRRYDSEYVRRRTPGGYSI